MKQILIRTGLTALNLTLLIGSVLIAWHCFPPEIAYVEHPPTTPAAPVQSRAELLVEQHDCWTGAGPAGVLPEHVVVTEDGDIARYLGPHMVNLAFEQVLGAVRDGRIVFIDHHITVHAFCR